MNLLSYSGGIDSTALAIFLKNKGIKFIPVFCDTGWEHPSTMKYIEYINHEIFGGALVTIRSEKYPNGMRNLVEKKLRVPSAKARFCTSELKVIPMIKYVQDMEVETIFQGIRADESPARSKMKFREFNDDFDCYVERPIFNWSKAQCFDILKKHGIEPNPLYKKGCGRVGCFPCVMVNHQELKNVSIYHPEIWGNIEELEKIVGRSFFPPNYIPKRFQTGWVKVEKKYKQKDGSINIVKKTKSFPWAKDVMKYLGCLTDEEVEKLSFLEPQSCMSIYNLCE